MRPTDHLADAVLAYARLGYRVLPLHHPIQPAGANPGSQLGCSCGDRGCGSVGKHPLTPHGLYDATDDPDQLAWWWRRWPQANIGLVTGEVADALDVDGLAGRAALRRWATEHGAFIDGPLVRTGTGWHFYLAPSGTGNRVGLLEHVDWRGAGGYVVAPPSLHHSGVRYRWLRPLTATLPEGPGPLRELLEPPRALQPPVPQFRPVSAGHPYGLKALQVELARVAQAPKGRRNHTLYQAGLRLYSLVAGGVLERAGVESDLLQAAEACGLLADEPAQTRRTLASAERAALAHPRGVPAHQQAEQPAQRPARSARSRDGRERTD
jgi:Bifunctional DNA primase/polymerase, N-terminal